MEIVMNVELEWDFADPDIRRIVDGFQNTPLLDQITGKRDVNMIHIKQRTGANVFAEIQMWQGRPIDYRVFVIIRHQDIEAILEAEELLFTLVEKIKSDLEDFLQSTRRPGSLRVVYSNNRITCGVCHASRQSSLKDFKLHVRSHIGDNSFYPSVPYKAPAARRPEPLAAPNRGAGGAGASRFDYESLMGQSPGMPQRRKQSINYEQMLRDYRTMDDDEDGGDRSFGRSRRRSRRRSRSPTDEDHYTFRKRRRRSRSGSYDSAERKRVREALYTRGGGSDEWSGGPSGGSRKRAGSSRYDQEMKKKPMYEQQAAMIENMIEGARMAQTEKEMKKQLEPKVMLTKKQRKMQARNEQSWMAQDTSWMQDISSFVEKKGGRKGMSDSGNVPNVMNMNLGEEHASMADAAAWYAKQRMMGMQQQQQQQQQQQMGGFGGGRMGGMGGGMMSGMGGGMMGGMGGHFGNTSGFVGGPGPGAGGLYPSLMGMMKSPGYQGGGRPGPMGGMGRGSPAMGGSGYMGGPGNFGGGGGPMQGRRQRQPGPKGPAKTPRVPETPINLELRPGFIADITLCDPRESSTAMDSETTPPKISVDKSVDPLKVDDPVGSRYWKGMPPQAASAKSAPGKTEDGETVLPELQEEKEDAYPIPSTFDFKLRYQDLKTSATVLAKKIPTMTADALKTALGNIGEDVEPEVMKLIREKHKEAVDQLKEDKYWLYKAQYEDVLNRTRQLGKLFCHYVTSDDYPVPEVKPDDGMNVLKIIMGKSEDMTEEKKVEKMEQFFTALLKQKETSEVPDEFWEERIKLLKECCGFNDAPHQNYIMKRTNQLQESIVKRTSEIPPAKEAQSMELNVIYAMVNEYLRQESTIDTINSRLDMRANVRRNRKSEKLKSLQEDAKLKAEMWNLERQAEDGVEEEDEDSEEEEEEKTEEAKKDNKDEGEKEEIKENGKDEDEVKKEKGEEEMETEGKENGNEEEKEKDETEEAKKAKEGEGEEKEGKPKKEKKPVEKIHPVIDEHPVTVSKESRRLWKQMLKIPVDKDLTVDECKELLEFLYETSPEDLYLRDVLSNFSWKKQVATIEEINDVPGMRYVCKDDGSGWFMFENCLAHSLVCKKELALVCPMCPEPHIMDAKNMWRYIKHVKNHQEHLEKFVEKVEKAEAAEKARIKAEEEAKVKAEEERKKAEEEKKKAEEEKAKAEEAKAKAAEEKAKKDEESTEKEKKDDAEEDMESKTDEDKEKEKEPEKEQEKTEEEKMDEGAEKETEEVKDKEDAQEKKDEMEVDKEGKMDEETKDEKDEEKKTEEMEVEEEEEVSEAEEELDEDQIKKLSPMFASLYKSAGEILKDLGGMRLNQLESVLAVIKNMLKSKTMGTVADLIEQDIQKDIRRETKMKSNTILKKYNDPSNRCREYIKVACKYIRKLRPGDEKQVKSVKEMNREAKVEEEKRKDEEETKQAEEEAVKAEEAKWTEEILRKEDLAKRIAEQKKRKEEKRKALEKKKKEAEAKKAAAEKKKKAEEEKKKKEEEAKKKKEEEAKKKKEEEAKEGDEVKKEGSEEMETDVKSEEKAAVDEEKAEVDDEAKDKETDGDKEETEEAAKEDEEEKMEEEEEEEEDILEEPEPERPMPWENTSAIKRLPNTLKTERQYYAMLGEAQKAKDEVSEMNTYKMDMTLQHFNTFLHHDDLRNIASLMRVELHKDREQAISDPLHHLKLNLRVTLDYILNILPDAHEGFEHFREFMNPEGKMKAEERFFRMERFFTEVFRHLLESRHSHKYWHTRVQTIRKAMKLTDTKRQKHRIFIARKRNYLQEEELFRLCRNLSEMESVTIRLKVHCEVALAMDKKFNQLVEAINFAKTERITDEDEIAALTKEKEEFAASVKKYAELFVNQDKSPGTRKSEDELTEEEKITFSHKHAIWWRGLLYDPVPQSVQRIPLNGQIAMFHNLMKDIPVPWLSLTTVASRANKKDFSKWIQDMEKTTNGHYVCGQCGFGTRKLITALFHNLLCGKSGWTFCPLCKTDLQTESMYWFDRHLERHVKHAESAFTQCGKPEITLGFTLNELVTMLVNAAAVIVRMREKDKDLKKTDDTAPEVECPSTEEKFNKTKETIKNILPDLDDMTNGELCDLGVQLRKAVGIKAMEDIREIVNEAIESGRKAPNWNPATDKFFKSSEARLGLTLKVGYEYMNNLEGHDISKSKGEVKEKTLKEYQQEHYTTDEEMLIVMYHQAVTCMRTLPSLSPPAMGYMEGKFNDIMRGDSTAEVGIVCQKEMERLKKENATMDDRDPTRINLKATCVYVLNMDDVEKKDGKEVKLEKPTNSEERFLALKKIVAYTLEHMGDIPPERLQVVLQRMKGSIGDKQTEEVEAQIKEHIEREKETPEWTEDKYENPTDKTNLEFKKYANYYTSIPYPDPYDGIERLKETWKPAKEVKTDTKLQIAKEVFSMLLKQKKDTKLSEEYWRERLKAVIKCIGVVSSQEYYNPHYTWIRNNQSEEQVALKNGRYPSESEAMMQHLKVLFAQVSRVIKKELTPGNVMEDIDMRPIARKTINTPNLDLLKEKFIKWAKEVLEGKVEEQKFPVSYEELKEIDKGEVKLDMQPINFADYKKTHKMATLEAPNESLMKKVIKASEESLKEGNKLEEIIKKIEFVDEGKYYDIDKRADPEETTDKHKAKLVEISTEKYVEGHYICGTCGAGFMMFDNCALHSLICGLEKVIVECEWSAEPFSFKQYNLYLYRYQRHMEKRHQRLNEFIESTGKLPPNPDAPVEEEPEVEDKEEVKSEKADEEASEKTEAKDGEDKLEEAKESEDAAKEAEKSEVTEGKTEDEEKMETTDATEEKLEESLLAGDDDVKGVQEADEEKLLADSVDTSMDTSAELDTSVAEEAKETAEEEKPKPQRPQRATRGRKRGGKK